MQLQEPFFAAPGQLFDVRRITPNSSNIRAICYAIEARALRIEFKGDDGRPTSQYLFLNVPPEVAGAGLVTRESVGKWFNKEIKGTYEGTKLDTLDDREVREILATEAANA